MSTTKGKPSAAPWDRILFSAFFLWVIWISFRFFLALYPGWPEFGTFFPSAHSDVPVPSFFERSLRLLGFIKSFGIGVFCIGIFWSLGKRLFSLIILSVSAPIRFFLQVVLGFVVIDWVWLGLGFTGLWSGALGALMLVGVTAFMVRDLWGIEFKPWKVPVLKGWDLGLAGVVLVYSILLFLQDLLPETFYDSMNYFLGMPAYWWSRHGITDQPFHILSGYFHGGSLIYLNGFLLGGGPGAKILAGSFLLGTAFLAWVWAGEWGNGTQRWSSAAAVLTFPLLFLNAWATRVDSLLTLVVLLYLYSIQKILEGPQAPRWTLMAGILSGLALSIKPTAIVPILTGVAILFFEGHGWRFLRKASWAWFGLFLLEAGPWLFKNLAYTGNPFFPYAANLLGIRPIPESGYHRLLQENQQFLAMEHGPLSWVTLPWRLTMPGAGDGQFLGPLLLSVLPILVFLVVRRGPGRPLSLIFWISALLGLGLSHMLRFSLPVFTLGFLLVGMACSSFRWERWRSLWPGMVLMNAVLCFPEILSLSAQWSAGGPYWRGQEDQGQYLSRRLGEPDMEMVRSVNEGLPADSRILFVGDSRVLYYDRQCLAQSTFDEPFFASAARTQREDGPAILKKLKELGITHVIVHQGLGSLYAREYHQYDALTPAQWRLLEGFGQGGLEPMALKGPLGLFKVRESFGSLDLKSPNPFSLLPAPATDCLAALNQGNRAASKEGVAKMLELFPQDPFWLEQKEVLKRKTAPQGEQ